MSKEEVHVFANVTAQHGKEGELRAALTALVAETKQEPGCVHYMVCEDHKRPGHFHIFEVYKNQAAVDAHMASPHLAAAFAKAGPLVSQPPSIIETKLVAGS